MSNFSNKAGLITQFITKQEGRRTWDWLIAIFSMDNDFTKNEEHFRKDTLELGYKNEADRLAQEIFTANIDEVNPLEKMVEEIFTVPNFLGTSDSYGDCVYEVNDIKGGTIIGIAFVY